MKTKTKLKTEIPDIKIYAELEASHAALKKRVADLEAELDTATRDLDEVKSDLETQRQECSEEHVDQDRFSLVTEPIEQVLKEMRDVFHRVRYRRENITPLEFIKEIEDWINQLETAENEI